MKKDHLLMLAAGFVLGAVVTFIVIRQSGLEPLKADLTPAAKASSKAPAGSGEPAFDQGQHEAMIAQFIEKAKGDPKDAASRIMLANIYYDKGDFIGAIPWYEEALKLEPGDTDVAVDLGVCYREDKQYQKALQLFDRALSADPKKYQALYNKAVVYGVDLKQPDKARRALDELDKLYPGDQKAAQLRGSLPKK